MLNELKYFFLCYMNEYLNPWYILVETGTTRNAIMLHFGNCDKPNEESTPPTLHGGDATGLTDPLQVQLQTAIAQLLLLCLHP